jgi:CIC family chloride channel protein
MAGGAVGTIVHRVAPFPTGGPGAYALVGMGTLFAGIIRAPMTSVFMIFEITQDYQILVPLMAANLLSFAISKRYQPVPVYHALLQQDRIHLPAAGAAGGGPSGKTARHVMRSDVPFIPPGASIERAWEIARAQEAPAYLVGTQARLDGAVTRARLEQAVQHGRGAAPIASIVDPAPAHAHPDHPLDVVFERFAESDGVLPIVSRADTARVEGVVTLDTIMNFVGRRAARDAR